MKVLEQGEPEQRWVKQLKCKGSGQYDKGCGALLEVQLTDLYESELSYGGTDVFFQCPECGSLTSLEQSEKPLCWNLKKWNP